MEQGNSPIEDYLHTIPEGYTIVVCHICGQDWLYPSKMAEQFDSEHPLECSFCKRHRKKEK